MSGWRKKYGTMVICTRIQTVNPRPLTKAKVQAQCLLGKGLIRDKKALFGFFQSENQAASGSRPIKMVNKKPGIK